jgi:hypothetical protein
MFKSLQQTLFNYLLNCKRMLIRLRYCVQIAVVFFFFFFYKVLLALFLMQQSENEVGKKYIAAFAGRF